MGIGNTGLDGLDLGTDEPNHATSAPISGQASLSCLIDSPELLRVRIRPADFARALGVSKQSVSRWVRDGWVMLAADGRLDPVVAIGQLLRRCDPGRLRARWLRQAITEVQTLREAAATADERVAAIETKLAVVRQNLESEISLADDMARSIDRLIDLLYENEHALRATASSNEWRDLIRRIDTEASEAGGADADTQLNTLLDENERAIASSSE